MTDAELRIECLRLANGHGYSTSPTDTVERAGSYYKFATASETPAATKAKKNRG